MHYFSTNDPSHLVSLRQAVLQGLPADNGLYMPETLPPLPQSFLASLHGRPLQEIAEVVLEPFLKAEVPQQTLRALIADALDFDAPLVTLDEGLHILELFHGPTLAFKDFGARFMARLMAWFVSDLGHPLNILVATSGDTGSAVANGFHGVAGINVIILYPAGKISPMQEQQIATLSGNITALAIDGTFDDCQRLVKDAFLDDALNRALLLSSANSINIARLLPQMLYYFRAAAQLPEGAPEPVIIVPSGNFGNLTAGLFARRMGLPVQQFVAATNCNDVVPLYLRDGRFEPRPSLQTISNAMDVGNPSNFQRMQFLYEGSLPAMRQEISGFAFDDEETREGIRELAERYQYIVDPHGAVAYRAAKKIAGSRPRIFLGTAHPAKFREIIEPVIGRAIALPQRLRQLAGKRKYATPLSADFPTLREFLLSKPELR